ncbi:MAG: choice-of-anchor B family protein [Colwellia sp.]|nr:choice-of-anchor B family protein [Colwellia sp.]
MNKIVQALVLTGSLVLTNQVIAHSEHDKARFVAQDGRDEGQCDNVLRPCASIEYAVMQANKGDKILVAAGAYNIDSVNELFYLQSALVPVFGGYNRFDHYQSQSPNSNITKLKNIPSDLAEALRKQGFNIIADGISSFEQETNDTAQNNSNIQLRSKLSSFAKLSKKQTNVDCIDNMAGDFNCLNMDLLAHMPLGDFSSTPSTANDIWGHVDLNDGSEYALIGLRNGVAVVNVTEPDNPVEVGTIAGGSSSWRDIKVYQYFDTSENKYKAYAYATIDNAADDVTIINLNNLPHSVSLEAKNTSVAEAHNVYISNVDHTLNMALPNLEATLQLIGTNKYGGAFHSYSLSDPSTLTPLDSDFAGSGYTHDGASLVIKDERCPNNLTGCTIFIDFNEKEMKLWDITNPNATKYLSTTTYSDVPQSSQYIHSGWGTEDNKFILLHDEFDEKNSGLNSTVRIFSIDDLSNPVQVGQWTGPTKAIDHNGFVRGNRYYMSNYERGLTVLDISDPANPEQVGFFDTYTPSDNPGFNGAWGVYPYLPSGNILVSDINSGLYIIKDNTKTSPQGRLGFANSEFSTEQGQTINIPVQRTESGDNPLSTSINYQVIAGSAKEGLDYVATQGILEWAIGDVTEKNIAIDISDQENDAEFSESFYIRLYDPTNSATLSTSSYLTVKIAGRVDSGSASFVLSQLTVAENQPSLILEVAISKAPSKTTSFNYQVISQTANINSDVEANSGQLTWQSNDSDNKSITLNLINDNESETDETFLVTLSSIDGSQLGTNNQITITIADDENNQAPVITLSENFEVNSNQSVSLTASVVDAENDAMTYQWLQTAGTNLNLSSADGLNATFVAPSVSTSLTFEFTATDFRGASTTQSITVSVVAPVKPSSSGGAFGYLAIVLFILLSSTKGIINRNSPK